MPAAPSIITRSLTQGVPGAVYWLRRAPAAAGQAVLMVLDYVMKSRTTPGGSVAEANGVGQPACFLQPVDEVQGLGTRRNGIDTLWSWMACACFATPLAQGKKA